MKPTRFIPVSLLLLMVACSQTSAPNDTSLSPQAVITVGGSCSLVDAIHAANQNRRVGGCSYGFYRDTIRLEAGHTYTLREVDNITRGDPNGLPVITDTLTIEGNGATIERDDAADTPQFRLFEVAREGNLTLDEVTVRNGDTLSEGGGIYSRGRLTVRNSTIAENRAEYDEYGGGGIYGNVVVLEKSTVADNEGGGVSGSSVELNKSIVRGNLASSDYFSSGTGIDIHESGTLTVTESIIEDNAGSGIGSREPVYGWNTITMTNSTVSNNRGAGIHVAGGSTGVIKNSTISGNGNIGIRLSASNMEIVSSTISGNRGFGISNDGGHVELNIKLSTITGTLPYDVPHFGILGGGIKHREQDYATLTLYHSIIANQQGVPDCVDPYERPFSPSVSEGFNLGSDGSCGLTRSNDQPFTDPRLGPLQDNGGPTQTHALLPGSPAIDAGGRSLGVAYDQRGPGFHRVQGSTADIGAYEVAETPSEPDTLCGLPEGLWLWALLEHPSLYIRFCEATPELCFWELCEAPPFLKLLPLDPCLRCGWALALPRETSLRLNFRIDAFAKDPEAFAEAFGFGLYTPEGELIRQGKLTEVIDPQTKEPYYALGLEADVSKGNYIVSVKVLDEKLWDIMSKSPEDYPFEFGFPNK